MGCPACGEREAIALGTLGTRAHYRCRACGMGYSRERRRAPESRALRVTAEAYARAAARIPERRRAFLSPEAFDAEALRALGARCYARRDRRAGFYIVSGDLRGLFALPEAPAGAGRALAAQAPALGARALDCFDGYLTRLYAGLGWVEASRVGFDPAQAPQGWRAEDGAPDVVFMRHDGAKGDRK